MKAATAPRFWVISVGGYQEDPHGSACGDSSIGTEASNSCTWMTGRPNDPFVTVIVTYFVTAWSGVDDPEAEVRRIDYADYDEHVTTRPNDVRYSVESQTEWVAHTDLDDPGGTEVASDVEYEDISDVWISGLEIANKTARSLARNENWGNYSPENWKDR